MNLPAAGGRRAVIVISSHVVRGSVGNRAAVFALETLGLPVWAVPTVTISWHPGHGRATRIVPEAKQFADLLNDLANARWLDEVGAVLSGYLGDAGQAEPVARLVAAVRKRNPRALYLCDPVMGDAGGLYVAQATAAAIRDHLMPLADILTPNRYELEWMTGARLEALDEIVRVARGLGTGRVLVTSTPPRTPGRIANILVTATLAALVEHEAVANPVNGLGDLTAAVFLARLMNGADEIDALRSTTAAVLDILTRTVARGADELTLETDAASLSHPEARVHLSRLAARNGRQ